LVYDNIQAHTAFPLLAEARLTSRSLREL